MRASSLSNAKIIDLLNHYFVAVHLRNGDFGDDGTASPQEKRERNRIYHEALKAGLPAGSVCAYVLTADARPIAVAPLNQSLATDPARLAEMLEGVVRDLNVPKGKPLVPPTPQSAPPACDPDSITLHLTARYLERSGDKLVPVNAASVLGTSKAGNWGNLPSEEWVVLTKAEWMKLLPRGAVQSDSAWELDREVTAKVLRYFFPPTENTNVEKNRIDEQSLLARVDSIEDGVARVRLEGKFRMKHPFYHKDDANFAEATIVGFMDFDLEQPRIRSLHIATDRATYGGDSNAVQPFGVAVRSVP